MSWTGLDWGEEEGGRGLVENVSGLVSGASTQTRCVATTTLNVITSLPWL